MAAHVHPFAKTTPLILHVWPEKGSAISIDPECVASLLFLQLCIPGRFLVEHCNNPDLSPSGQLPFLTHGVRSVATFSSIAKYVLQLSGAVQLDVHLAAKEKAQTTARIAHLESELGNLVAHVFYAMSANWTGKTRPTLVSILPIPQRYFIPQRLRESYRPRLEAALLWSPEAIEQEEEEERQRFSFRKVPKKNKKAAEKRHNLEQEKVLNQARAVFDVYARLLGNKQFLYHDEQPSTLDVILAAHVHLLLQPMPDPLLQALLSESYSTLCTHSRRVYDLAFSESHPAPPVVPHKTGFAFSSIISMPRFWTHKAGIPESPAVQERDNRFALLRWGFFGTAFVALATHFYFAGVVGFYKTLLGNVLVRVQLERLAANGALEGEDELEDLEDERDEEEVEVDLEEEL